MERVRLVVGHLHVSPCSSDHIENEVTFQETESVLLIRLNRPKALNAVNLNMIERIQQLLDHAKSTGKKAMVIRGEGNRAFCAGGDIRALATSAKSGNLKYCAEFFSKEFGLDCEIALLKHSDLAYVSLLNGITMGGGVGLSVHSKYVIASETIKFAMPETGIGFFCDVGGSYFLPRLPGEIGAYIALTGYRLSILDVLYCGIATHYCPSSQMDQLEEKLGRCQETQEVAQVVDKLSQEFPLPTGISNLEKNRKLIDKIFSGNTMEQIILNLKNEDSKWSCDTLRTLSVKSPTSLKLELECMRRGKHMTIQQVKEMEYCVAMRCMKHPDFYEGVRALIIEKDNKPKWAPATLEEVTMDQIFAFFRSQ